MFTTDVESTNPKWVQGGWGWKGVSRDVSHEKGLQGEGTREGNRGIVCPKEKRTSKNEGVGWDGPGGRGGSKPSVKVKRKSEGGSLEERNCEGAKLRPGRAKNISQGKTQEENRDWGKRV